ncbi:MAG: lipopolysaccharide biosynthesis protein [Mycobacteriales bacterium]
MSEVIVSQGKAADAGEREASRALLGKGSVYTIATAVQLAGALLVQPALSRLLPREEYGRVALAIVVTNLLGLLLTVGLPAVVTREYFRHGTTNSGAVAARAVAGIAVSLALVIGLGVAAVGPLWAAPLGGLDAALLLGAATAITFSMITTGQALLRAKGQAGRFVLVVLLNVVGGQLLGLLAINLLTPDAGHYLAGVGVGSLLGAALSWGWTRPIAPFHLEGAQVRGWFAIALPTLPHTAALYLMTAGDRFVVEVMRGAEQVAGYSLAYLVGALGITLVAAANNAWAPLIYGAPEQRRWAILASTTKDMAQLGALLAGGLALAAPLALWIVADPSKYDIAALTPVVALTALATVPYVLYLASAHVLFWTGKTTALLWITPLAAAINLGAKALVLPWGGFAGAAVVTVAAYGVLALLIGGVRRNLAEVTWSGRGVALGVATAACVLGAVLPLNLFGHLVRAFGVAVLLLGAALIARRLVTSRRGARTA